MFSGRENKGIVLITTMALLAVMTVLGYLLSSSVAEMKHRNNYLMNYQSASYACDSAVNYITEELDSINLGLVSRPNEPDFSDVFAMTEEQYQGLIDAWEEAGITYSDEKFATGTDPNDPNSTDANSLAEMPGDDGMSGSGFGMDIFGGVDGLLSGEADFNDPDLYDQMADAYAFEPNEIIIRGPYGYPWPQVQEPMEFEIGDSKIKIEVHDENAKYPITWLLLADEKNEREVLYGFKLFTGWMGISEDEADELIDQLYYINELKPYDKKYSAGAAENSGKKNEVSKSKSEKIGRRRVSRSRRSRSSREEKVQVSAAEHMATFIELLDSPLVDKDLLGRATIETESRTENALKYISFWGTTKVNINTAPRHVLEAAFAYGGYEVAIADEIIENRRLRPFENISDLKKTLFRFSSSINKAEDYITTSSEVFTLKLTASSGAASKTVVIGVRKVKDKYQKIATLTR